MLKYSWVRNRRKPESLTESTNSHPLVGTHNETLSVAAMRLSNPDRSPVAIYG